LVRCGCAIIGCHAAAYFVGGAGAGAVLAIGIWPACARVQRHGRMALEQACWRRVAALTVFVIVVMPINAWLRRFHCLTFLLRRNTAAA